MTSPPAKGPEIPKDKAARPRSGNASAAQQSFARHLEQALLAALSPQPDERVLLLEHGNGRIAAQIPHAVSTDRLFTPGVRPRPNVLCLPEKLPFQTASFASIGGLDTLGHSPSPAALLAELERCLKIGGRVVLVEPWMSLIGGLPHLLRGQRRISAGLDPWFDACADEKRESGNAAVARACLDTRVEELPRHTPTLTLTRLEPFGGLAETASLSNRIASQGVHRLLRWEYRLPRFLRRFTGSRVLVILEKVSLPCDEDTYSSQDASYT